MRQSLISILLLLILTACAPIPQPAESPLPAPTAAPVPTETTAPVAATPTELPQPTPQALQTPQAGMGAVSGRLSGPAYWEDREITAYACPFTPNKEGTGGFFILEPSIHPHAIVAADGSFAIPDVPPGAYVIVAGPSPEEALAYRKTDQAAVIEVTADEVLDLGNIEIR
jgi:hypothetical protein